jgi:chromosome segregation ATPase
MASAPRNYRSTIPEINKQLGYVREKITRIDTSLEECTHAKQRNISDNTRIISELHNQHEQNIAAIKAEHNTKISQITAEANKQIDTSTQTMESQRKDLNSQIANLKAEIDKLKHKQETTQLSHNSEIDENKQKIVKLEQVLLSKDDEKKLAIEELRKTLTEQNAQFERQIEELTKTSSIDKDRLTTEHHARIEDLVKKHQQEMDIVNLRIETLMTEKDALIVEIAEMNIGLDSILDQSMKLNALTDKILAKIPSSRGGRLIHKKRYTLKSRSGSRSRSRSRRQIVRRKSIKIKTKARK